LGGETLVPNLGRKRHSNGKLINSLLGILDIDDDQDITRLQLLEHGTRSTHFEIDCTRCKLDGGPRTRVHHSDRETLK
jgi:hypothetical protein